MRSVQEVQRAHDIFEALVLHEVRIRLGSHDTEVALHAAVDVLCWVLGAPGEHNPENHAFADLLAVVELRIAAAGYVLHRSDEART